MLRRSSRMALVHGGPTRARPAPALPPVPEYGASVKGARALAEDTVRDAETKLAAARDGGSALRIIEATALSDSARDLLAGVERAELNRSEWLSSPDVATARADLKALHTDGRADVLADLDAAVDALLALQPRVAAYNRDLREAAGRLRAGEPGMTPARLRTLRHPDEIDLVRYVLRRLRQARS